ncbi:hypothetical protein CONPUDRAFT_85465, partial [Coniophora puteana RWD-64-598 SS2]
MDAQVSAIKPVSKRSKVEDSKRLVWKLGDLPAGAHNRGAWTDELIPTLIYFFGGSKKVWDWSDVEITQNVVLCWQVVYGTPLPEDERAVTGPVFNLAKKKLIEWRSNLGTTAIAALVTSFAQKGINTPQLQQAYIAELLDEDQFLNSGRDLQGPTGMLKGDFLLVVLACHHLAIVGRVDVPQYDNLKNPVYAPYAATVLAAAAVYRALKLAQDGLLGDINGYIKGIDPKGALNLSTVNKTKRLMSNYKAKERARVKKEREEREKAREDAATKGKEKAANVPEPDEEHLEDDLDDDMELPSIPPFSKDHNEATTFNYTHLIVERCSRASVAEALAMSSQFASAPVRQPKASSGEQAASSGPARSFKLDVRAYRRIVY